MRNTLRYPTRSASAPPMSGPMMPPAVSEVCSTPRAAPIRSGGIDAVTSALLAATNPLTPPWTARRKTSCPPPRPRAATTLVVPIPAVARRPLSVPPARPAAPPPRRGGAGVSHARGNGMHAKTVLLEMLRDRGVRHVFGIPATTELNFMEMFADYPEIAYVLALQDAIPVGMGYGYAQATGTPAFVNLHITPGLANGLGNIFNAQKARTPMVITAGQVDRRLILQEPTLWSDLARLASQYTKWSYEV